MFAQEKCNGGTRRSRHSLYFVYSGLWLNTYERARLFYRNKFPLSINMPLTYFAFTHFTFKQAFAKVHINTYTYI